ncbi:MAG: helix-turn-helix transcriptional regulator [Candidatus Omnitrophica bacterium]|nr:helix-turn-helix transcriptional regulator [Candidatus Omnitrophota bacterium]
MKRRLRIKELAAARGITLISIAMKLGIARSNMSAIASGKRGVSLKVLYKISCMLDCTIDELILPKEYPPVFKNKKAQSLLKVVESQNYDGIDRTWVNRVMLAQQRHYGALRKGM